MPAVNGVGEPCAGEPHARIEVAAGGNPKPVGNSRAELGASRRPYTRRRPARAHFGEKRASLHASALSPLRT